MPNRVRAAPCTRNSDAGRAVYRSFKQFSDDVDVAQFIQLSREAGGCEMQVRARANPFRVR
jgi:hypothetical protein